MPKFLYHWLARTIWDRQANEVWDWLNSNSNTVIVDELMLAIRARRSWKEPS